MRGPAAVGKLEQSIHSDSFQVSIHMDRCRVAALYMGSPERSRRS